MLPFPLLSSSLNAIDTVEPGCGQIPYLENETEQLPTILMDSSSRAHRFIVTERDWFSSLL